MPTSKTASTSIRRLTNKVELLNIDNNYRKGAYIEAYTLIGKLRQYLNTLPQTNSTVAEMVKLVDAFAAQDDENFQTWVKLSRNAKREQREAKAKQKA